MTMSEKHPEFSAFDKGFAHGYPRDRGLVERFQEETGRRTITEVIPVNDAIFPKLVESDYPLFDYEQHSRTRVHYVPADARDFVELIRLGRDSSRVNALGELLGKRMAELLETVHAFPADTVLPRFAGYSSSRRGSTGGIEIKMLPPFDRFTEPRTSPKIQELHEIIESDLLNISYLDDEKFNDFMTGYSDGIST